MSLPTAEEKVLIKQFRARVKDVLTAEQLEDDWFLIRWLRARELDLNKAEAMIRNSMKWREENQVDSTLQKPVDPYFRKHFPFDISGIDRQGRALLIIPLGKWDIKVAVESGRADELVQYLTYFFESLLEKIRKSNSGNPEHPHTQFSAVVDWDGYSFRQFTNYKVVQTFLKLATVYEAHYPEILGQVILINSTSIFQMVFALAKKLVSVNTIRKVMVFGTNRSDWELELFKMMDPDKYKFQLKPDNSLIHEQ